MTDFPAFPPPTPAAPWKLWIYTNYDCNLWCSYCVARSNPRTPRNALSLATVQRIVDEAVPLGVETVYFTGGEPFLLPEIYDMLAYAAQRLPTVVLTNAILLRGARLDRLSAIAGKPDAGNLVVQVSLDGGSAAPHDAYRGAGTWEKTVAGIKALQARGVRVRLSTTETPANSAHLEALCAFHHHLGIPEEDHIIRPLARRGFSTEGMDVTLEDIAPEITLTYQGVYWHPLGPEEDFHISSEIFPLAEAFARVCERMQAIVPVEAPRTFQ